MRRIMIMIGCLFICVCVGCSNIKPKENVDTDIQDIDIATSGGSTNAFDDHGFYHVIGHDMKYVGADAQIQNLYHVDPSCLDLVLNHQGIPYVTTFGGTVEDGVHIEMSKIERWDSEKKKMKLIAELNGKNAEMVDILSMAATGNYLYYTTRIVPGETIMVDGNEYYEEVSELYRVDLTTGEQEKIYEIESDDRHYNNYLVFIDGVYPDKEYITLMHEYGTKEKPDQWVTDFYRLDLKKDTMKEMKKIHFDFVVDMAYQYQNCLYYCDERDGGTDFNYIDLDTDEIRTVFTNNRFGYMFQDYISFWSSGQDPRNYLYSYKDGKLYVSKENLSKSACVVGVGDKYLAIDEMDYTNVTEQTEDIGIYKAVDKENYISQNYTEYNGESADVLTFYGRDGKGAAEAVTTEVD